MLSLFSVWPDSYIWAIGALIFLTLLPVVIEKARFSIAVLIALLLGIALASHRIQEIPTGTIDRETFVKITGILETLEYRPASTNRLTLRVNAISSEEWLVAEKVRLTVRTHIPDTLRVGTKISVNAVLDGMPGAIVPGGFNFETYLRRQGIAAHGFAVSPVALVPNQDISNSWDLALQNIRDELSTEIHTAIDPSVAGVAVSITTGQRNFLSPETARILRDSGLSHLLAISGLHMGLVTAAAFFVFELLFAAIPPVANRMIPRKAAAVFAWIVAVTYLGISGASVSTLRAFIMVSIAILALLTDRRVISLRSVALAAIVVTLFDPLAILSISFQMSFAATTGLVIVYDLIARDKLAQRRSMQGPKNHTGWRRFVVFPAAMAGTSLVAQVAIAPIALYHFQALSLVGIGANVLAVPIMAFVVMPSAFLGVLCISLGIEPFPFWVMEQGLLLILEIANFSADFPLAVYRAGPFSDLLLGSSFLAFILISFFRSKLVLASVVAGLGMSVMLFRYQAADILIDNAGRVIAHRLSATKLEMAGGRTGGFRDQAWKRYWGMDLDADVIPLENQCDSRACGYRLTLMKQPGKTDHQHRFQIVRTDNLSEVRQACTWASVVIASFRHRQFCKGRALFLAQEDIEKMGPVGIWLNEDTATDQLTIQWSNPEQPNQK